MRYSEGYASLLYLPLGHFPYFVEKRATSHPSQSDKPA